MKIAITGHCDGIGKAIYDKLADKGHELIGFDIACLLYTSDAADE